MPARDLGVPSRTWIERNDDPLRGVALSREALILQVPGGHAGGRERVRKAGEIVPNESHIGPELDAVLAPAPEKIVEEIVHRNSKTARPTEGVERVDLCDAYFRRHGSSSAFHSVSRKTPAKRVDLGHGDHCRIAECKALDVVERTCRRRLAGKLWSPSGIVVLQVAAPENGVPPVAGDLVIQLRDISVKISSLHWRRSENPAGSGHHRGSDRLAKDIV